LSQNHSRDGGSTTNEQALRRMRQGKPVIIWTRSEGDWLIDARHWESNNPDDAARTPLLRLPCIATVALTPRITRRRTPACIFTSANAVRYALADARVRALVQTAATVYTHGSRTASELDAHGIPATHIDVATGSELAKRLAVLLPKDKTPIIWPSADQVAHDFTTDLEAAGIAITRIPVYSTERRLRLPGGKAPNAAQIEEMIDHLSGIVCFASPSAVEGFVQALEPEDNRLGEGLLAVTIGPTTQTAAQKFFRHVMAIDEATIGELAAAARLEFARRLQPR